MGSRHFMGCCSLYLTVGKTSLLRSLVHFSLNLHLCCFSYLSFLFSLFFLTFPAADIWINWNPVPPTAKIACTGIFWFGKKHMHIDFFFFNIHLLLIPSGIREYGLRQALNCASFSCDNSSLKPVSTYFKGPFDNEDVLCQGNQLWCTVRNKKVFNREELQCTDFTGRFKTSIFISTKYQASSMTTSCTSKLVNYFV